MVRCKQKCVEKRREYERGHSTWRDGRKRTQRHDSVEHHEDSEPAALVRVLRFFGFPDFVTGL
jgi:hypothetical protein